MLGRIFLGLEKAGLILFVPRVADKWNLIHQNQHIAKQPGVIVDPCKSCIWKVVYKEIALTVWFADANEPQDPSKQWVNLLKPVHCFTVPLFRRHLFVGLQRNCPLAWLTAQIVDGTLQDTKWFQLEGLGTVDSTMLKHSQIFYRSGSWQTDSGHMSTRCFETAPMNGR